MRKLPTYAKNRIIHGALGKLFVKSGWTINKLLLGYYHETFPIAPLEWNLEHFEVLIFPTCLVESIGILTEKSVNG
jgi:hypothetical protein